MRVNKDQVDAMGKGLPTGEWVILDYPVVWCIREETVLQTAYRELYNEVGPSYIVWGIDE